MKDLTLAEYLAGVLPPHTAVNRVPPRSWTWSTPAGVWKVEHTALILQGRRPAQIRLLGPDMSVFMPDDEAGIGIVMAILRTVGAVDRDEPEENPAEWVDGIVARCQLNHWPAKVAEMTDAECAQLVTGVLAVLEFDGRLSYTPVAVDPGKVD